MRIFKCSQDGQQQQQQRLHHLRPSFILFGFSLFFLGFYSSNDEWGARLHNASQLVNLTAICAWLDGLQTDRQTGQQTDRPADRQTGSSQTKLGSEAD